MKIKVAKDFYWEMSHRLPYHRGLCQNLHGHSYKMRIELEGEANAQGMVLDYYEMSKIVKPVIEELDHAFVCDENDKLMIDFLRANNFKMKIIPYFSTAENLCLYLLTTLLPEFRKFKNLSSLKIRLFETEDVYAEMYKDISK